MVLPASVMVGYLWNVSAAAPFAFGAFMVFIAFVALRFLTKSTYGLKIISDGGNYQSRKIQTYYNPG